MEKDICSLKIENKNQIDENRLLTKQFENQTIEMAKMKSLVQHLLDLLHSGDYSTSEVNKDVLGLSSNKKRSTRSTIEEPTHIGKETHATKIIRNPRPRMLSEELREFKIKVAGDLSLRIKLYYINDKIMY